MINGSCVTPKMAGIESTAKRISDPSIAKIVLSFDETKVPSGRCGIAGPDSIVNSVITSGHGWFSRRQGCGPDSERKTSLAHEIGHILGLGGHTPLSADVMSYPQSTWNVTPLLSEITNWLHFVPSGTRLQ